MCSNVYFKWKHLFSFEDIHKYEEINCVISDFSGDNDIHEDQLHLSNDNSDNVRRTHFIRVREREREIVRWIYN